jgi:hypothetical protein
MLGVYRDLSLMHPLIRDFWIKEGFHLFSVANKSKIDTTYTWYGKRKAKPDSSMVYHLSVLF